MSDQREKAIEAAAKMLFEWEGDERVWKWADADTEERANAHAHAKAVIDAYDQALAERPDEHLRDDLERLAGIGYQVLEGAPIESFGLGEYEERFVVGYCTAGKAKTHEYDLPDHPSLGGNMRLAFVNVPRSEGHYQHNTQPMSWRKALAYAEGMAEQGRKAVILRALPTRHRDPIEMMAHHESFLTTDVLATFEPWELARADD